MSKKRYYVNYFIDIDDNERWIRHIFETENEVLDYYKRLQKNYSSEDINFEVMYGELLKIGVEIIPVRKLVPDDE